MEYLLHDVHVYTFTLVHSCRQRTAHFHLHSPLPLTLHIGKLHSQHYRSWPTPAVLVSSAISHNDFRHLEQRARHWCMLAIFGNNTAHIASHTYLSVPAASFIVTIIVHTGRCVVVEVDPLSKPLLSYQLCVVDCVAGSGCQTLSNIVKLSCL